MIIIRPRTPTESIPFTLRSRSKLVFLRSQLGTTILLREEPIYIKCKDPEGQKEGLVLRSRHLNRGEGSVEVQEKHPWVRDPNEGSRRDPDR